MFDKILTNLAFDPSYLPSLKNFQRKESRQRTVRGVGLFFVVLAMLVQVFAFVSAPQSQAAASANDLLPGGVKTKNELVKDCKANKHQVKVIYGWYGVSCADISKGSVISLRSTAYNGKLRSVGHLQQGFPDEIPAGVAGSTLWWRYLHDWDSGKYSTYTAVKVRADSGKIFFILFGCGNFVSIGQPQPFKPPKKPKLCKYNNQLPADSKLCKPCTASANVTDAFNCLTFSKAAANVTEKIADASNTTAKAGDVLKYTLKVTNTGKATARDFVIQEDLNDVLDYAVPANLSGGSISSGGILSWAAVTIEPMQSVQKIFTVQVKNPVPTTAPAKDDPEAFNSIMTNIYGNTINIKVQQPIVVTAVKTIATTTALPNTGPGASIVIFAVIAILAGYFYLRSRLLLKESAIAETVWLGGAK